MMQTSMYTMENASLGGSRYNIIDQHETDFMDIISHIRGLIDVTTNESLEGMGMDKTMADQNGLRLLRNVVRNKESKLVDISLEKNAPLLFAVLKPLMEEYNITRVALQKMKDQKFHCDLHAHSAKPEDDAKECHLIFTVDGHHSFGVSSLSLIQDLEERYTTWPNGGGAW